MTEAEVNRFHALAERGIWQTLTAVEVEELCRFWLMYQKLKAFCVAQGIMV